MKSRSKTLCQHSLNTALSAIEIYNKPDFKDREQIFCILMVNAWETLVKAKIVADNGNKLTALYIREGGRYKRNRTKNFLTVSLQEALERCPLSPLTSANIHQLIEIRDAATHLTAESPSLPYIVFTLGTASLRNYSRLLRDWFDVGVSDYNFYILPLGFAHSFKTLTTLDLKREPESIAAIIQSLSEEQKRTSDSSDDFHFLCEITTTLKSAKKISEDTDFVAKVDTQDASAIIVRRDVSLIDQYPYSFTELWKKLKAAVPTAKQMDLVALIKRLNVKEDPKYARHNFRSKSEETRGATATTAVIYNDTFLRFAIEEIGKVCDGR